MTPANGNNRGNMHIARRAKGCMEVHFGNKHFEIRKNIDGWEIAYWEPSTGGGWLFSSGQAPEGAFNTRKAALQALTEYVKLYGY